MRKGYFETSLDTQMIYDHLATCKGQPGKTVTYDELTELLGKDVREKARSNLYGALKMVQRDYRLVFENIPKVGFRVMEDRQIPTTWGSTIKHIRRVTTRGIDRLACVEDFNVLTPQEQAAHNTGVCILGAMRLMTEPKKVKQLTAKVAEYQKVLPLSKTLGFFAGSSSNEI